MNEKKTPSRRSSPRPLSLRVPAESLRVLDRLAAQVVRTPGASCLSREEVLAAVLRVFAEGQWDLAGVNSEREFVSKVRADIDARLAAKKLGGKP
jgi:hypothetical protein